MKPMTRRSFLTNTLAAAATVTIAGTKSSGRVLGANDVIRVGVAGIHGQGNGHIEEYVGLKGVQITYLIDPDTRLFASRSAPIKEKWGQSLVCVQDIRKALEDKELDAISIATPNHWHSLMTIWACQAGKDVYVEKPLSHNISEGRRCGSRPPVLRAGPYGQHVIPPGGESSVRRQITKARRQPASCRDLP